ncbi:MAG: hypothetical protein U5L06_00760 [Rhodovibrio sp.]|nr:hypothetical protein [Rhodovibrio sp.]
MASKHELLTDLCLLIDDANGPDQEIGCRVTYTFQPGCRAYTPRGEYAPTEPPELDMVEDVKIEVQAGTDEQGRPVWQRLAPVALHDRLAAHFEEHPEGLIERAKEAA